MNREIVELIKKEIDRAFLVLGADKGFAQNAIDLIAWHRDGAITENEYTDLRDYNRAAYSALPLDW